MKSKVTLKSLGRKQKMQTTKNAPPPKKDVPLSPTPPVSRTQSVILLEQQLHRIVLKEYEKGTEDHLIEVERLAKKREHCANSSGCFRRPTKNMIKHLHILDVNKRTIYVLQSATLLGIAHTLHKYLKIS